MKMRPVSVSAIATLLLALFGASSAVSGQVFREFLIPTNMSGASRIVAGPDGALSFTENSSGKIGTITTSGIIVESLIGAASGPDGITVGPDGALWFCEGAANKIGRITTEGDVKEFPLVSGTVPVDIASGPDGALWFTESGTDGGKIGRIDTNGTISEFPVPTRDGSSPEGITAGPDGNMWFTENVGGRIGRITTGGAITEFDVTAVGTRFSRIVAGPDGALWFTEIGANKIGRSTTTGFITEFPIPTAFSLPDGIAAGPDGALWFTERFGNKIGRITTAGVITEFTVPTSGGTPIGIAAGPDGALWFTEINGNKIGRVTTPGGGTPVLTISKSAPASVVSGQNLTYTLTYGNTGSGNATAVLIRDTLPAGTDFVSATGGGTLSSGVVTWNIGGLNAGVTSQSVSFTVRVTASAGVVTNSAYAIQASGVSAVAGPPVSTTVTAAPSPALTISKSAAASVVSGQNLTYTLTYGNSGSGTAAGVVISDVVPAGTTFVSATGGGTFASGVVTWTIGGLGAGVTGQTVSFTVAVSATSGSVVNAAYSIQAGGIPPISGPATSTAVIPATAVQGIVAVVASIPGVPPSLFKTGFQMHNPTASVLAGRLVFHPQGVAGSDADPSFDFSLTPGQTMAFADLLPAMGLTGPRIGSLDIVMPVGASAPVVFARIFNDGGAGGTTGFTLAVASPDQILGAGDHGVLLTPADTTRFRMNIGVRTGPAGASMTVVRRNAAGAIVQTLAKSYPATFFEQISGAEFLAGTPFGASDSITIQVTGGSAIVYAITADNTTQDPSIEFASRLP
jgi:virginiamycin B lyase